MPQFEKKNKKHAEAAWENAATLPALRVAMLVVLNVSSGW